MLLSRLVMLVMSEIFIYMTDSGKLIGVHPFFYRHNWLLKHIYLFIYLLFMISILICKSFGKYEESLSKYSKTLQRIYPILNTFPFIYLCSRSFLFPCKCKLHGCSTRISSTRKIALKFNEIGSHLSSFVSPPLADSTLKIWVTKKNA